MKFIKQICRTLYFGESEEEKPDSAECTKQREKCILLYEELSNTLNEEQRKKLCKLDSEYFLLSGQWNKDGFDDGAEKGLKAGIRLIIDSMRDD